jgi:hypothetical protein
MDYLVKDEKLVLMYAPGKGAWTYHIQIPNTRHIKGKWGSLKVAGFIDKYKLESKNLFTISGQDKLIAVNEEIRKAIGKSGGDQVTVTLYLLNKHSIPATEDILQAFSDAEVLDAFNALSEVGKNEILEKITRQKTAEKQVDEIVKYISMLKNA